MKQAAETSLRHPSTVHGNIDVMVTDLSLFDLIDYAAEINLDRLYCGAHNGLTIIVLNSYGP